MAQMFISIFIILALNFSSIVLSYDPTPLQDFCVADFTSTVRVNGLPCKDPARVEDKDFFYSGLHIPGNTSNSYGAGFNIVSVDKVPGLNTLGLYLGRLDFQENGYIPPHYHHRGSEIITVLEGTVAVGFITTNPEYRHFRKVLEKGDVFVVPVGLLHYLYQVGKGNSVLLWAINSQNPGITTVTSGVFGAKPEIDTDFLSRAFYLDKKTVEELQSKFA